MYLKIARKAVETYLKEGKVISTFSNLSKEILEQKAGVFVSIYKSGDLRGCIGTFLPTKENIVQEIISNAIAVCHDPRFLPLQKEEIPFLKFSIDVLSLLEQIFDLKNLDPKKYGILVKAENDNRTGLLLPDIPSIDSIEKQISIACQKAGIDFEKEKILIYRFTTKRFKEW